MLQPIGMCKTKQMKHKIKNLLDVINATGFETHLFLRQTCYVYKSVGFICSLY